MVPRRRRAPGNASAAEVAVGLTRAGDWARQPLLALAAFALEARPAGRSCPLCDARIVRVASVGRNGGGGAVVVGEGGALRGPPRAPASQRHPDVDGWRFDDFEVEEPMLCAALSEVKLWNRLNRTEPMHLEKGGGEERRL